MCRDGRLVGAEVIGDVMYWREECLVQASICREKAQADPARYDYWIDQAVVWLQRAAEARHKNAVTHEIHAGRMIPKRAH
jgi:TPR repeat protein